MDWSEVTGPQDALIIPGLPNVLRNAAEAIESAQTTGPPEEWLEPTAYEDLVEWAHRIDHSTPRWSDVWRNAPTKHVPPLWAGPERNEP
jgi:hypothetical protein